MVKIEIENIHYKYGKKQVLNGITHVFQPGKFTAIMGQNGSGKTTLIKCMSKELTNNSGQILIDSIPISSFTLEALAQKIAFVPQGQETFFGSTVFETILLGRLPFMTWSPSNQDFQLVDKVIGRLNLKDLAQKNIKEISGGERQKVYIARAIAQDTPIIILDEPITYLDLKHQFEIMRILKDLSFQGKNVVMVVHDINLALRFCDEFVFIKNGLKVNISLGDITEQLIHDVFEVKMKRFLVDNSYLFI